MSTVVGRAGDSTGADLSIWPSTQMGMSCPSGPRGITRRAHPIASRTHDHGLGSQLAQLAPITLEEMVDEAEMMTRVDRKYLLPRSEVHAVVARLTDLAEDPDSPATVLVTHHVEEIPEGFTHALTLREGKVVGSGPLQEVLTADTISTTFGMPLEVTYDRGRYAARGLPAGHGRRVAEARG